MTYVVCFIIQENTRLLNHTNFSTSGSRVKKTLLKTSKRHGELTFNTHTDILATKPYEQLAEVLFIWPIGPASIIRVRKISPRLSEKKKSFIKKRCFTLFARCKEVVGWNEEEMVCILSTQRESKGIWCIYQSWSIWCK